MIKRQIQQKVWFEMMYKWFVFKMFERMSWQKHTLSYTAVDREQIEKELSCLSLRNYDPDPNFQKCKSDSNVSFESMWIPCLLKVYKYLLILYSMCIELWAKHFELLVQYWIDSIKFVFGAFFRIFFGAWPLPNITVCSCE